MARLFLALASGAAFGLAYRPGWWGLLAAPALAGLLAACENSGPAAAFRLGAAFGASAYACGMPWIFVLVARFVHAAAPVAALGGAGLCVAQGLPWGLTTAAAAWAGPGWRGAAAFAAAVVAAERFVPALFPVPVASTQLYNLAGVQCVGLLGTAAVAWLVFGSAAVLDGLRRGDRAGGRAAAALLVLLAGNEAWGAARLGSVERRVEAAPKLRVAVAQAGVDDLSAAKPDAVTADTALYPRLTRQVRGADLVVWPESSFAPRVDYDPARLDAATAAGAPLASVLTSALGTGAAVILNAVGQEADGAVHNIALAVDGRRRAVGVSEKALLMPFGEYMPFGRLGAALRAFSPLTGTARPGRPAVMSVGGARVGVMICYENMVPGPAARLAALGAQLLVAQVNDAWFDGTMGPEHHLKMGRLRAIETGLVVVEAANTGVSAVIQPTGRVSARLGPGVTGVLPAEVALLEADQHPARADSVLRWLALCAAALLAADGAARRVRATA